MFIDFERQREREREREIASQMCSDWGLNLQSRHMP